MPWKGHPMPRRAAVRRAPVPSLPDPLSAPQTATDADIRQAWEEAAAYECYLCGVPFVDPADPPEVEHVRPVSRGGTTTVDNLLPAHRSCNRAKGDRPAGEVWAELAGERYGCHPCRSKLRCISA